MSTNNSTNTVSLRFTGSRVVRRIINEHEWSADNDHTQAVPLELAADLLTSREADDWELAEKPKPAVLKQLAELMGAPPELVRIPTGENGEEVNNG